MGTVHRGQGPRADSDASREPEAGPAGQRRQSEDTRIRGQRRQDSERDNAPRLHP